MGAKRASGPRRGGSGGLDARKLAKALSYPGIDPRLWVSQAYVVSEEISVEAAEGVFVDVMLLPSLVPMTVRVAPIYAGGGFGLYTPLAKDDEVTVLVPSGDPNEGGILVSRTWSPSDVPPEEVGESPEDVVLVVQENKNVRIVTKGTGSVFVTSKGEGDVHLDASGSGDVLVTATGSGLVKLGGEAAEKGVAKYQDPVNNGFFHFTVAPNVPAPGVTTNVLTWTPPGSAIPEVLATFITPGVASIAGSVQVVGILNTGSDKVKTT